MPEINYSFASRDEWLEFRHRIGGVKSFGSAVVEDVEARGLVEPITGIHRAPHELLINPANLRESLSSHQLNSRKRALLLQLTMELEVRGWSRRDDMRMLAAESVTRPAAILRGRFSQFTGTEYLPSELEKEAFSHVTHCDLQDICFEDSQFDVVFSDHVLQCVPNLGVALSEIYRVLSPGGLLVSSFPFVPARTETICKARLGGDEAIEYLKEPEYHGNPVAADEGSLVYSLPGWDLLSMLAELGYVDPKYRFVVSSKYGVACSEFGGIFLLSAQKAPAGQSQDAPIKQFCHTTPLPAKVVSILGLPRSGTTLLSSIFSVHSKVEAIFEPWNAGVLSGSEDTDLSVFLRKAAMSDLRGKTLFVKETATKDTYIENMSLLQAKLPFPVDSHNLIILRRPDQTYLSEVIRRSEWWGDNVEVSQQSFDKWCAKHQISIRKILRTARDVSTTLVTLEALAADTEVVMAALSKRVGLEIEPHQLNYENSLDTKTVRGDRNVQTQPKPINRDLAISRAEQEAEVSGYAALSPYGGWFEALKALHLCVIQAGGVLEVDAVPQRLLDALS